MKNKVIRGSCKTSVFSTATVLILTAGFLLISCFFSCAGGGQTDSEVQQIAGQVPFSRGVTFGSWLQGYEGGILAFNRYSEQDFEDVKSLGADVIRLPVHFHHNIGREPDYVIDPMIFTFLDKAVDWAEKYEIYLIIDFHPYEGMHGNIERYNEIIDKMLIPIWTQVAQRYRDRSEYVIYEILNEPGRSLTARRWGELQGRVIETIRRYDTKHSIIAAGAANTGMGSAISDLNSIPRYSDTNLIYTFHFYDPWIFTTGQGSHHARSLSGIPFPYDRNRMPAMPQEIRNTWIADHFNRYPREGNPASIYRALDRAVTFSRQRNVPIICGEFGVNQFAPRDDSLRWYQLVADALDERGIPRTIWDFYGYDDFGIFNFVSGDINSDLDVELARVLGFTPPPQRQREAVRSGFDIFDVNIHIPSGDVNFHVPVFDLSYLAENDFVLEFMIRSEIPASLEAQFYHFEDNIQWCNMSRNQWHSIDRTWQTIRIPLSDFVISGGWDPNAGQWFSYTRGRTTSWTNIRRLRFSTSDNVGFYIDGIKITR